MKISIYTSNGEKNGTQDFPAGILETEISPKLMHEAVIRQQANARTSTASIKTKSQVRGGGRKPWKQKGTGRARQGSIRSAQWRGGGVIFGPTVNRNYTKQMPKKMRRKALFSALKSQAESCLILEGFEATAPKTKDLAALMSTIGLQQKVLVVLPERNTIVEKSARNIPDLNVIFAQYLNIVDILSAKHIIFFGNALERTQEIFGIKK